MLTIICYTKMYDKLLICHLWQLLQCSQRMLQLIQDRCLSLQQDAYQSSVLDHCRWGRWGWLQSLDEHQRTIHHSLVLNTICIFLQGWKGYLVCYMFSFSFCVSFLTGYRCNSFRFRLMVYVHFWFIIFFIS